MMDIRIYIIRHRKIIDGKYFNYNHFYQNVGAIDEFV